MFRVFGCAVLGFLGIVVLRVLGWVNDVLWWCFDCLVCRLRGISFLRVLGFGFTLGLCYVGLCVLRLWVILLDVGFGCYDVVVLDGFCCFVVFYAVCLLGGLVCYFMLMRFVWSVSMI